jgi:isopentenyl-diphosphate delta-isomerase
MELWQLYDEQGRQLAGQGCNKDDGYSKGLLHGSAHVWLWRLRNGKAEVLLQLRAPGKRTWPNCYDISAAGHIDLGEAPLQAGLREMREEIGLTLPETDLALIGVNRETIVTPTGAIENELEWVYLVDGTAIGHFELEDGEVTSMHWIPLETFKAEHTNGHYVPHEPQYFALVIAAIEKAAARATQQ